MGCSVLRGKFIAVYAYIVKEKRSQINNLTLHLKKLEKKKKTKSNRWKEIIKIRVKINKG